MAPLAMAPNCRVLELESSNQNGLQPSQNQKGPPPNRRAKSAALQPFRLSASGNGRPHAGGCHFSGSGDSSEEEPSFRRVQGTCRQTNNTSSTFPYFGLPRRTGSTTRVNQVVARAKHVIFGVKKELEKEDSLLQHNPRRWVMFPIQHEELYEFYKKHKASFWTAEEIDLMQDLPTPKCCVSKTQTVLYGTECFKPRVLSQGTKGPWVPFHWLEFRPPTSHRVFFSRNMQSHESRATCSKLG